MAETSKCPSDVGSPRLPELPRDLADFHVRWPQFRALTSRIAERPELPEIEREMVRWLVRLADRVGPRDLA